MSLEKNQDGKPRLHPADEGRFDPPAPDFGHRDGAHGAARYFRRGPWEMAATILIALGVVMMMQPFVLILYTWSFIVTLVGTLMFIIVSHFPD